tara:strand:+ start:241 stop:2049 length:1809 start_codon:yes stop_codon:yes gene_type:complete
MTEVESQDYFRSMSKEPVMQKSIRIPSQNGLNYVAGQEIIIKIDPNLKYFNPSETYLEGKVKINAPTYTAQPFDSPSVAGATPTRLQLDAETGVQCLCRTIRIMDSNGVELESIENYNTMVAFMYDYQTNDSMRNKRALTECSGFYNSDHRGTFGSTKSVANNLELNPFYRNEEGNPINASWTDANFVDAKFCIPLNTGIFGAESKAFPNAMLGGIQISILLEDNNRVFRQVDSAMRFRRLTLNPQFKDAKELNKTTYASVNDNGSFNTFRLVSNNSQHSNPQQCPFVVGEKLGFQRYVGGNASIVQFQSASGVPVVKEITMNADYIQIELNASVEIDGKGMNSASQTISVFSQSVSDATSYEPTYTVSDVNLIVQELIPSAKVESDMMSALKSGGKMVYDFLSVRNYKSSQLSTDRVFNMRLPLGESMAKAIFCIPTDATVYTGQQNLNASETYIIKKTEESTASPDFYLRSNRSGLEGISDYLSDYIWVYNGRLQPNRKIDVSKVSNSESINAQHLIELDKALSSAKIFGHSYQRFNQNFCVPRALALGNGVYDARGKDFVLQLNYNETTAPTKNKLWMNFVYHIRSIEIEANGNVKVVV